MQKWQYKTIFVHTEHWGNDLYSQRLDPRLNRLGKEGWKLFKVITSENDKHDLYIFERPLEEKKKS